MTMSIFMKIVKNNTYISGSFLGFILLFLFIVFFEWTQNLISITSFSGFKYLISLILFFIFWINFSRRIRVTKSYLLLLVATLFFSILNISPLTPFINQFYGLVLTFSFTLIFLMAYSISIKEKYIYDGISHLIVIIFLLSLFPVFSLLLSDETTLREVSVNSVGNYSWNFFRELGAYGLILVIGLILSLSKLLHVKSFKWIIFALVFTVFIFLTGLKKSMLESLFIWTFFVMFAGTIRLKIISVFFLIILFPLVLSFMYQQILNDLQININYFNDVGAESHVRLGMYLASFNIAIDNFPFGSGMGSFGSTASIYNFYSPVYFEYGIDKIGSNAPEFINSDVGHTLLDTFWPHILAELGFFGFLLFSLLFFYPSYSSIKIMFKSKNSSIKSLCFVTVFIPIIIGIDGLALYTPEIPLFILFHAGLVGFCLRLLKTKNYG